MCFLIVALKQTKLLSRFFFEAKGALIVGVDVLDDPLVGVGALDDPPLSRRNSLATFSFDHIGAKEKVNKKKSAEDISRSAEREEGFAPPPHKLLKKLDQNFSNWVCANFEVN